MYLLAQCEHDTASTKDCCTRIKKICKYLHLSFRLLKSNSLTFCISRQTARSRLKTGVLFTRLWYASRPSYKLADFWGCERQHLFVGRHTVLGCAEFFASARRWFGRWFLDRSLWLNCLVWLPWYQLHHNIITQLLGARHGSVVFIADLLPKCSLQFDVLVLMRPPPLYKFD